MKPARHASDDVTNKRVWNPNELCDRTGSRGATGDIARNLLTLDTKSFDSSVGRTRGLQRQNRVQDREIEPANVTQKCVDITERSSLTGAKSCSVDGALKQDKEPSETKGKVDTVKGFVQGERQPICKTVLVDPEGNVVSPEIAQPKRKLPTTPTARIKYPGVIVDKSPSGIGPLDTNEFYKYKSRYLEASVINDYRFDSSEDVTEDKVKSDEKVEVSKRKPEASVKEVITPVIKPNRVAGVSNTGSLDNPFYEQPSQVDDSVFSGETIPLKQLKGTNDISDYRRKIRERIRLKSKSLESRDQSVDIDTKGLAFSHLSLPDNSEARKTVAFKQLPNVHHTRFSKFDPLHRVAGGSYTRVYSVLGEQGAPTAHEGKLLSVEQRNPTIVASKSQSRLYNQSSTETSGLGETITSGCSSQESLAGYYGVTSVEANVYEDLGIDLREGDDIKEGNDAHGIPFIDSNNIINHTNELKESGNLPEIIVDVISGSDTLHTTSSRSLEDEPDTTLFESSANQRDSQMKDIQIPTDTFKVRAYKPPPDFIGKDVKKPETLRVHSVNVGPNFDDLFNQSRTTQQTVGLKLEQINNEWNKQKRGSSIKSRSSQGSFRSRSGSTRRSRRFLGHKESMWMKWGAERRASYRRRMENLKKPEPEIPRASTPVKKARQEGLVFIHPDLESKYISEDDINYINRHKHERLKAYKLIEKNKNLKNLHEDHELNRLTPGELMVLSSFWEHRVFNRSRYISILLSLATTVIYILSICSTDWITYPSTQGKNT